jgi:hypothetical protein
VKELSKEPTSKITPRYNLPPLEIKTESGTVKEARKTEEECHRGIRHFDEERVCECRNSEGKVLIYSFRIGFRLIKY